MNSKPKLKRKLAATPTEEPAPKKQRESSSSNEDYFNDSSDDEESSNDIVRKKSKQCAQENEPNKSKVNQSKKNESNSKKRTLQKKDNVSKAATTTVTSTKPASSSSSSDSSDSEVAKPVANSSPKKEVVNNNVSSNDSSDTSSDSSEEEETVTATKTVPVNNKVIDKKVEISSNSSSDSSSEEDEESTRNPTATKTTAVAPTKDTVSVTVGRPKRKRKRKNKNKNKLPADQIPVFEAVIEPAVVRNNYASNAGNKITKFDDNIDNQSDNMEVEAEMTFSAEDIQKLYSQSVSSSSKKPSNTSNSNQTNGNKPNNSLSSLIKPVNANVNVSCENILLNQLDKSSVSNNATVAKPSPMFKPRVLSVNEMKVNVARKQPLVYSNGQTNGIHKEIEVPSNDAKSQLSALLNCNGQVFDRNQTNRSKDYTVYHLVSDSGPRVGDVIAFKHMQLDENYCPGLSDYKEGTVIECDGTNTVTFEMITTSKVVKSGKFEIEKEQNQEEKIQTFQWAELHEPRLIFP